MRTYPKKKLLEEILFYGRRALTKPHRNTCHTSSTVRKRFANSKQSFYLSSYLPVPQTSLDLPVVCILSQFEGLLFIQTSNFQTCWTIVSMVRGPKQTHTQDYTHVREHIHENTLRNYFIKDLLILNAVKTHLHARSSTP